MLVRLVKYVLTISVSFLCIGLHVNNVFICSKIDMFSVVAIVMHTCGLQLGRCTSKTTMHFSYSSLLVFVLVDCSSRWLNKHGGHVNTIMFNLG